MSDLLLLDEFAAFVKSVTGEEPALSKLEQALVVAKSYTLAKAEVRQPASDGAGTPPDSFPQEDLRKADFIRLPKGVKGTNCGVCEYQKDGVCQFSGVSKHSGQRINLRGLQVTPGDCCAEWDAEGTDRVYQSGRKSLRSLGLITKTPGPHSYGTTMLMVSDAILDSRFALDGIHAWQRIARMAENIPDEDLAEEGRELEPHLTIKYGLMTDDPEEVKRYVEAFGKVRLTLGKTNCFQSPERDVVYVDVAGNSVRDLNNLIDGSIPNHDVFPVYNPHITLAYVKPGTGPRYVGLRDVEGIDLEFNSLVFSDPAGNRSTIYLTDPDAKVENENDQVLAVFADMLRKDAYRQLHWVRLGGDIWRDSSGRFEVTPWAGGLYFNLHDRAWGTNSAHRDIAEAKRRAQELWDQGKSLRWKSAGAPCKPGETAASDGCIPASRETADGGKPPSQDKPSVKRGRHPGIDKGSKVKVRATDQTAIGDDLKPVKLKTVLSKQETGRLGEAVVHAWLKTVRGFEDAKPLNSGRANEAIDAVADSMAPEIKSGLASNSKSAQQWRITFSMNADRSLAEKYNRLSQKQKAKFNEKMQQEAIKRKTAKLKEISQQLGINIKPVTITTIINPDTQVVDIFMSEGYHQRLGWKDAKRVASVEYDYAE